MENNQHKGLKRNTIDKFYTKNMTVQLCLGYVKKYIQITTGHARTETRTHEP